MKIFFENRNIYINNNYSISYKLFNVCRDMQNANNSLYKFIDISSFNYLFSIKYENFGGLVQQDYHEFLIFLLDELSKEFNEIKTIFTHRLLCNDDTKNKLIRYIEFKNCVMKKKNLSYPNIFIYLLFVPSNVSI